MIPPVAWSLELGTTGLLKTGSASARLLRHLPAGTRIFLPALPADPPTAIEEALGLLHRENAGLVPVPHIAASREASTSSLETRLAAWQRASSDSVREALIVRGDPRGAHSTDDVASGTTVVPGAFGTSLELLETGVLQRCGIDAVSLCGHPEGVGGLSPDAARAALSEKLRWADANGVHARVVTQFCFSSGEVTGFVDALRADGLGVDVSLGIVGPSSLPLRQRMAERCDVAPPTSPYVTPFMRRLAAWQAAREPGAGVQALHLYPFGGLTATLKWLADIGEDAEFSDSLALYPPPLSTAAIKAASSG